MKTYAKPPGDWLDFGKADPQLQSDHHDLVTAIQSANVNRVKQVLEKTSPDVFRLGPPGNKKGTSSYRVSQPLLEFMLCNGEAYHTPLMIDGAQMTTEKLTRYNRAFQEIGAAMLDKAPWLMRMDAPKWGEDLLEAALKKGMYSLALRMVQQGASCPPYHINYLLGASPPTSSTTEFHRLVHYLAKHSRHLVLPHVGDESWWPSTRGIIIERLDQEYAEHGLTPRIVNAMCTIIAHSPVKDMVDDFSSRVLVPAYHLMRQERQYLGIPIPYRPNKDTKRPDQELSSLALRDPLLRALIDAKEVMGAKPSDILRQFDQLSRSWHHAAVNFHTDGFENPDNLQLASDSQWHPLFDGPFTASNGLVVHCLTNPKQLGMEGAKEDGGLDHCVNRNGYAQKCLKGSSHILSIRTPEGVRLSTVEVALLPDPFGSDATSTPNPYKILVEQHMGYRNDPITANTHPEIHRAFQEFLAATKSGAIRINTSQLGETDASKRKNTLPPIVQECGYPPTWNNVNLALQQFKEDLRAAATHIDGNDRLHYAHTPPTFDGYRHRIHLLEGYVADGKDNRHNLRDMDVRELLRATELGTFMTEKAQKGARNARDYSYNPDRIRSTLPPPEKPEQPMTPRQRRQAWSANIHGSEGFSESGRQRRLAEDPRFKNPKGAARA